MQNKILRLATITACLLIIPVLGNRFVEGWNWSGFDFVWAGTLIFGTAAAQALVPVIALFVWSPTTHPWGNPGVGGVFILNSVFTVAFVASGLLFRQAAGKEMGTVARI